MDINTLLPLLSGVGGSGALMAVLYLVAAGKLVPGSTHEEMRKDRDFYREKFHQSTNILGNLLSAVEAEPEEGGR